MATRYKDANHCFTDDRINTLYQMRFNNTQNGILIYSITYHADVTDKS